MIYRRDSRRTKHSAFVSNTINGFLKSRKRPSKDIRNVRLNLFFSPLLRSGYAVLRFFLRYSKHICITFTVER